MFDDFWVTADRMMQDARALAQAGAYRNACYLAGYVVECTLKKLLEIAGSSAKRIHDLETLQDQLAALLLVGNAKTVKYGNPALFAPTMLTQIKPAQQKNKEPRHFCHWDPEHRYDGSRWQSKQACDTYLLEADKAYDIIIKMLVNGDA